MLSLIVIGAWTLFAFMILFFQLYELRKARK